MNLSRFFLDNYKFTLILTALIVVFGLNGMSKLNSESYPAVDFATATVTTHYDGASAEEIETRITKPIEKELRTVSGIKDVRSISQAGESKVHIRLDIDNVNVREVMPEVQRAVDRVSDLPSDLTERPRFVELKSEEFPVIELAIVGSNKNRQRDLIAETLQESIEDHKEVLNVRFSAHQERQFRVQLHPQKMSDLHVGINEVIQKIQLQNVNVPGGLLKSDKQRLLRVEGKFKTTQELGRLLIRSNFAGQNIRLSDIASIIDGEEESKIEALYNGQEATLLTVTKKSGTDTIALVEKIDHLLEQAKSRYPKHEIFVYNNEAEKVKNRLEVLSSNAISGLVLVIVFLLIFLPGRVGIMASLSLPIAVLATFGFMPVFGMNLNAITILALVIALGMLVDNSVVISENFARLRKSGYSSRDAALISIQKLWLPISATAFTTIAAFLPMLVTTGIMGQFIKWIPIVVTISLLASLVECFFFLPMRLVDKSETDQDNQEVQKEHQEDWFSKYFISRFEKLMSWFVNHSYLTALLYLSVTAGSFYMMVGMNQFILFPADQTEVYFGRVELKKGVTLQQTENFLAKLSNRIQENDSGYITSIVSHAGLSQTAANDPLAKNSDNVGMLRISVNDVAKNSIPSTEMIKILESSVINDQAIVAFEALANGPPVGKPVNGTLRSSNTQSLDTMTKLLVDFLNKQEGVKNVETNDIYGDDRIYIDIDHDAAARYGLDVVTIGNMVRNSVSGIRVSDTDLNNREVDIFVEIEPKSKTKIKDLNQINIMDSRGFLIPLNKVAKFHIKEGKPQINRYDFQRSKTISADINAQVTTAVMVNQSLQKEFLRLQNEYPEVSLIFGGEEESTKESMTSLFQALILSLIGIFGLLVFLFRSYLRPLIIMTTIPLGLIGFSIAFYFHQRPISFLALIGIIGLGGIIVNSGIVLISFIDDLRKEHPEWNLNTILIKSSGLRLRAVMVSSLTTISGLLPTAYGIGGSDAILIPMTLAMAWGLTSGTILTLVWVPCAYRILEDIVLFTSKVTSRIKHATINAKKQPNEQTIIPSGEIEQESI